MGIYPESKNKLNKKVILPGIEPGISGSVDQRLIHWATGPEDCQPYGLDSYAFLVLGFSEECLDARGEMFDALMTARSPRRCKYVREKRETGEMTRRSRVDVERAREKRTETVARGREHRSFVVPPFFLQ